MKLLTVGSDRKIFEEGSAVSRRQITYGESLDSLDIIVYARKSLGLKTRKLSTNITAYSTNSYSRLLYFIDAFMIARSLNKPDIVSAQDPFESGVAAYLISRYFGTPLHLQVHTDFLSPYFSSESLVNKIRVFIARFLIKRADSLRVVSERIKRSIVTAGLKGEDVITVQPIFVDVDKIKNAETRTDLHKKYPQFNFIILMASRLTIEKNISLAIEAMREIVKKYSKIGLIIVGDGLERAGLKLRIKDLALDESVVMEDWCDDLPSYYKTADLFLMTSNYEGYGMAAVEALAAGLPVAMTDVGCAGDVVVNGKNGLVFPVGDLSALVAVIEKSYQQFHVAGHSE